MVNSDPDLVFYLSLDGEVSCAASYASIRGPVFLSVRGIRFERLISLLRVQFSLGVFYIVSCQMLLCVPKPSFFLPTVDFVLLQRRICDISSWSVLLCGVCEMRCSLLLDSVST